MATMIVTLNWDAAPVSQEVTGYNIYEGTQLLGVSPTPEFVIKDVPVGLHVYEVAPVSKYGEGPHSDQINTPDALTKPTGLKISITVNVQVG